MLYYVIFNSGAKDYKKTHLEKVLYMKVLITEWALESYLNLKNKVYHLYHLPVWLELPEKTDRCSAL